MVLIDNKFIRNGKHWTMTDMSVQDRYLIALADGMGGHSSGEVASSDVLHNLQFFYGDLPSGLSSSEFNETIFEWLQSINSLIDAKGHVDAQFREMGTTLVAFAYYNHDFYWMNCGDSRIYRLNDSHLEQVSTDHSLDNLIGDGVHHPGVITNCIGGGCQTSFIDITKCTDEVQSGDIWMLCSDGLTDMVNNNEIEYLLNDGADANRLCDAAIAAGGFDNVSACVIKVV